MQLLRCHVENFGRLSDVSLDFQKGLNILYRENGWGKSSLAVFICAMFYGLANDKKHGEADNERKHYLPWQGGTFGGNLTFSDGEGEYTIYRSFSTKAREDFFELRDDRTNLPSTAYTESVGEELFQVNRESFLRTAILLQDSCETSATSGINAKIHNLAEDTSDMNNYDQVSSRLQSEMMALSENRSTGRIAKMNKEAAALRERVRRGPVIDRKLAELEQQRTELQKKLEKEELQQEELLQQQKQVEYRHALSELREREESLQKAADFFCGQIPSGEEIEEENERNRKIEMLREQRQACSFSEAELRELKELDRQFEQGVPEKEELDEQQDLIERIRELLQQGAGKENRHFTAETEENDSLLGLVTEIGIALTGMIVIVIGILAICLQFSVIGGILIFLGTGIIFSLSAHVYLTGQMDHILYWIRGRDDADLDMELEECREYVRNFLGRFTDRKIADQELEDILSGIIQDAEKYRQFGEKVEVYKALSLTLREEIGRQNEFLDRFFDPTEDAQNDFYGVETQIEKTRRKEKNAFSGRQRLRMVSEAKAVYENCLAEYRKALQKAEIQKEETEKLTGIPVTDLPGSAEDLARLGKAIADSRLQDQKQLQECGHQIEKLREERAAAAECTMRLEILQEEIEKKQHEYEVLRITREMLARAQANFTVQYMGPIMKSFLEYYRILDPASEKRDHFYIDADSKITIQGGGIQRTTDVLSRAYQDMIGICIRMALLDAMYPAEKPFLLMDDPMANFDENHFRGGMEFLKKASGSYQILYLTCH